jgi:hypothetical protein
MSSRDDGTIKYSAFLVEDIDDLLHFARRGGYSFLFRGQSDYRWPLQTKLERDISERIKEIPGLHRYETLVLDQFKRRAHLYLTAADLPPPESPAEWLAFIQHYGGPTRLLDFTRSIFIATYFAIGHNNKADAAVVYVVNQCPLVQKFQERRECYETTYPGCSTSLLAMLNDSITNDRHVEGAIVFDPVRQNRRLLQQQGVFIVPLSLAHSFQDNLSASSFMPIAVPMDDKSLKIELENARPLREETCFEEYAMIRLLIPRKSYEREDLGSLTGLLGQMNLGADTLFPDLQGQMLALEELMPRS